MTTTDDPRQRLLNAAGEVFAEKGFKGATVRAISRLANVNVAAVNYYFRDKEHLYINTVKQAACGLPVQAQDRPWPPETPPADKLRGFIRVMLAHFMNQNRPAWHTRIVMREMTQPTSACAELVRESIAPAAAVLMEILDELLPPDLPRWKRFMTGFSIVSQCLYYLQNRPIARLLVGEDDFKWFDEAHLAEHIAQFSLAALGVAAQPSANGTAPVR
jgi:TetR/AcrR family transcriptional regulator, regulator of cefoperazone and chloramphenicol sensitivity